MSSSFIKVREEAQKKRDKDRQKLRTEIAAQVLAGIAANPNGCYTSRDAAAEDAVKLTDALLVQLSYGSHKVEPSPLTEDETSQIDD